MIKPTDYQIELARTDQDIRGLEEILSARPHDPERTTRYVYRLYHRATLKGAFAPFQAAEAAIDRAIGRFGPKEDLCLLKANLDFKFHRLPAVKRDLEMAPDLAGRFEGRSLLADLDFQEGRYQRARLAYQDLIHENRTWDNLARLAHLESKIGDADAAAQLYIDAEDELTAKEMRSFAWLEVQRGLLDLSCGRHDDAAAHYKRAGEAYSGHWFVDEHVAALMAAQGDYDAAIALYENALAVAPRPEVRQTLGELYESAGQPGKAQLLYDDALAAYLESVERGDVHYYHHLVDFYNVVRPNGPEAVRWALADIALRDNFSTQGALAWALYRNAQIAEACEMADRALSSGVRDSHLFISAATIHRAAGHTDEVDRLLHAASKISPTHKGFHVHH
jgi:tetratricopeptide (TPR) repeat protein